MPQSIRDLPLGAKVKFGKYQVNSETPQDIVWLVVNHSLGMDVLLTERIIDGRPFDGKEPENPKGDGSIAKYGNDDLYVSNLYRWLNSYGIWYKPAHEYDTPPSSSYVNAGAYMGKMGFLEYFTDQERELISEVRIPSVYDLNAYNMFGEAGWDYFKDHDSRACPTAQFVNNNVLGGYAPSSTSTYYSYWVDDGDAPPYDTCSVIDSESSHVALPQVACLNPSGVRPYVWIDHLKVRFSDTVDSDGCYTPVFNDAPSTPTLYVPENIYEGQEVTVTWSPSYDADGDAITYSIRYYYDSASSNMKGANTVDTFFTHVVEEGHNTITYVIQAKDAYGSSSTSQVTRTIIPNKPPDISGEDGHLGVKTDAFSLTYSVSDSDSEIVNVVESVGSEVIRSFTATLGEDNEFTVPTELWLKLPNGTHSLSITAKDDKGGESTRSYTFEKKVTSLSVKTDPMPCSDKPTRITMRVTGAIPDGASLSVMVCNNANDEVPTWENATNAVIDNYVYVFENAIKTADEWAVSIQVTVQRNGAEGACYITSIGGSFE